MKKTMQIKNIEEQLKSLANESTGYL